jgi:7-cyano-7-deazaguanine synthase
MTRWVVLSGGLDSTCLLAVVVREHGREDVRAVSFHYGQRHRKEVDAAKRISDDVGVDHEVRYIGGTLHGSALLDDVEVPHGHYAESSMAQTVVQGRNLLFAASAVGLTEPGDTIYFGVHAGDHPVYADCRPEFWAGLGAVVQEAYGVRVETPFVDLAKHVLLGIGWEVGAPVSLTWSCYEGGEVHCGKCGTCVERAEAFFLAGVPDPTVYADPSYWRQAVG